MGLLGPLIPTLMESTNSTDVQIAWLFPLRAIAFALGAIAAGIGGYREQSEYLAFTPCSGWSYDFYFIRSTNWNSIGFIFLAVVTPLSFSLQ